MTWMHSRHSKHGDSSNDSDLGNYAEVERSSYDWRSSIVGCDIPNTSEIRAMALQQDS